MTEKFPYWKYNPLDVRCPQCEAEVGEPCRGRRGPRVQKHMVRWQAAAEKAAE